MTAKQKITIHASLNTAMHPFIVIPTYHIILHADKMAHEETQNEMLKGLATEENTYAAEPLQTTINNNNHERLIITGMIMIPG